MNDPITLMDAVVLLGVCLIGASLYRAALWWIDWLRDKHEQRRFIIEWKRAMRNERSVWLRTNKTGDGADPDRQDGGTVDTSRAVCNDPAAPSPLQQYDRERLDRWRH